MASAINPSSSGSDGGNEDEEWRNSSDEGEEDMESEFEDSEEEEDEEIKFRKNGRSLLWLCQEGQLQIARKRFEWLQTTTTVEEGEILFKEVFQVGHDKNYALHEVLMGGTSDSNAYQLTRYILTYALLKGGDDKKQLATRKMLSARPPSHQRTALHWAAWGCAKLELLQALVQGYPEALVLRDKRNQNERTPAEILKHYYHNSNRDGEVRDTNVIRDTTQLEYLERCTASWIQHRLRLSVHMSIQRWFGTNALEPFDERHRLPRARMKPKPWFVLSVLASLMQREMQPLAMQILGYLGHKARVSKPTKKKKRRGSSSGTANEKKSKKTHRSRSSA